MSPMVVRASYRSSYLGALMFFKNSASVSRIISLCSEEMIRPFSSCVMDSPRISELR